jgi:hypothetical protein
MASLYEYTCDAFSAPASIHSIYDPEKHASVPKSLYEYNIPIDADAHPDVCAFDASDFSLYTCDLEDEKHKAESTTPNTIILESDPDSDSDSDSEVDDVNVAAPPAYTLEPPSNSNNSTTAPTNSKRSFFRLASILSSCLGWRTPPRSMSSSTTSDSDSAQSVPPPPPPPYVSKEEIELMEERMRQLDIFFGGAPL